MVVSCGYGWSGTISSSSVTDTKHHHNHNNQQSKKAAAIVQSKIGIEDVTQFVNNKVVIAAGVSSAIGQLAKPFTSAFIYGKRFDFGAAFQSGGFPSTHSSAVVATAASLGFERGFSDSVFGMSVVYAALVMYDAQGVRKEVGEHAKVMNRVLLDTLTKSPDTAATATTTTCQTQTPLNLNGHAVAAETEESCSFLLLGSSDNNDNDNNSNSNNNDILYHQSKSLSPLKESVGHTAVEVAAGALLGLFVSLALYSC